MTAPTEPTWLTLGRKDIGIAEAPGVADNAVILGWAKALALGLKSAWLASFYQHDSIPWCALWVSHILYADGKRILPPGQLLGAMNWRSWGVPLSKAIVGAVLVFTRDGGGHVGFYVGETADGQWFFVLGGNQGDRVCIERLPRYRCVAIRWPQEVEPFGSPCIMAAAAAQVSTVQAGADLHTLTLFASVGQAIATLVSPRFWRNVRWAWRHTRHHAGRVHGVLTRSRKP